MEIQNRKKDIEREIEQEFLEMQKQQLLDFDRKEKEKVDELQDKKTYRMQVVAQQLKDSKIKK